MTQICKIVTSFALILQLASSIQAQLEPALAPVEQTPERDDVLLYYAPSPYGDDKFPESQYPFDDMAYELESHGQYPPSPSPPPSAYSPGIEQDYPYNGGHPSPSPSPYIDVMAPEVDDFYDDEYSPSGAPSPKDYGFPSEASSGSSMASPPPAEWEYRAEDDAEYLSGEDDEDEEGYGEKNKRGTIGFVIGAVCLAGLGGLVYRIRRKSNQKRKHPVYLELSRTGDV